ncbi:ArsR/SmtB family transcription factor [Micromonospora rubida]|uniref:ArsR/SmtB family transcription factor n=1 Tax=Micromonospora rubida TaxID=2697657 RepID=A0ABW7SEJ4_9ACTN
MSVPLYQAKAELFRTLGHPARIRVLELLQDGPKPVRELLAAIDVEASNLSQQLAVLRRAGIVTSYREGPLVMYSLSTPDVADLLAAGRRILGAVLTDRDALLDELRAGGTGPAPDAATSAGSDGSRAGQSL